MARAVVFKRVGAPINFMPFFPPETTAGLSGKREQTASRHMFTRAAICRNKKA
jgi:hypothetical protein